MSVRVRLLLRRWGRVPSPLLPTWSRGFSQTKCRPTSAFEDDEKSLTARTRNIGIIAHIDAVSLPTYSCVYTNLFSGRVKLPRQSGCSTIVATQGELEVGLPLNLV